MSAGFINKFLDAIPDKKPFVPECSLYIGMHINYLNIHIERTEKKYFKKNIDNEMKYFTILSVLRPELKVYSRLYKYVREGKTKDAIILLLEKVYNREACILHYIGTANRAREDYRLTRKEEIKHMAQGYKKVVLILANMGNRVEKWFTDVVNNDAIVLNNVEK